MIGMAIFTGVLANMATKGIEYVVNELNIPGISPDVFNEIQKAHDETLDKWAKNEGAKSNAWLKVSRLIKENYSAILNKEELPIELQGYLECFRQTISLKKYESAYNYLTNKQNQAYFEQIGTKLDNLLEVVATKDDLEDLKSSIEREHNKQTEEIIKVFEQNRDQINGYLNSNNWDLIFGFCEDSIKKLAPKSVLKTIEYLESSNELKRSENKNFLISKLLLYKAECYALLRDDSKVSKLNIQAYEHDSSNIAACSRVALIYAVQGNLNKSKQLYETLLQQDGLNKHAWLCQLILCEQHELASLIEKIPLTLIDNPNFILFVQVHLLKRFPDLDTSTYFDTNLIVNNLPDEVDSANLNRYMTKLGNELMYLIESNELNTALQKGCISQNILFVKRNLEQFVEQINRTEISEFFENFRGFLSFMKFLETKEKPYLDSLRTSFEKSSDEWKSYLYDLLLNSVLAGNNPSEILEVIDLTEDPTIQLLSIRLNVLFAVKNEPQIIITANSIIQKSKENLKDSSSILIDKLFTLYSLGYYQKLDLSKIQESGDRIDILIIQLLNILIDTFDQSIGYELILERLNQLSGFISTEIPQFEKYVAKLFYANQDYKSALEIFNRILNFDIPTVELAEYYVCRYRLNDDITGLIISLEQCRKKFPFEKGVTRIELELAIREKKWQKAVEISEYYIESASYDEFVLLNYLQALREVRDNDKILKVSENISITMFSSLGIAQYVAEKLNELNIDRGMELLFELASDRKNKNARRAYHFAGMFSHGAKLIKWFDIVEVDCYVKYMLNDDNKNIVLEHITTQDPDLLKLVRMKRGESLFVERSIRTDKITIIQIHNKFGHLWEEISLEGQTTFTGPESFWVIVGNPKNIEKLIPIAPTGFSIKSGKDEELEKYYSGDISFSEYAYYNHQSNYLEAWNALHSLKNGLAEVIGNEKIYDKFELSKDLELVVDFTSLFELYYWSSENELKLPSKFLISSYLIQILEENYHQLDTNLECLPEKEILFEWIDSNCSIANGDEKYKNQHFNGIQCNLQRNYILDTIAIFGNNGNRKIIANDSIFRPLLAIADFNTVPTRVLIDRLKK